MTDNKSDVEAIVSALSAIPDGQKLRADLRGHLDQMDKPVTYANEDFDRANRLFGFLQRLAAI